MNRKMAARLLLAASVLMLSAGTIFGLLRLWLCAVLLIIGALGCFLGAWSFKHQ